MNEAIDKSVAAIAPDTKATDVKRHVQFKLDKLEGINSWMAFISEDGGVTWRQLRPSRTTFESAQAAVYDEMVCWAFPR